MPPSTRMFWPLIQAASGPASMATALAMSAGWPSRRSEVSAIVSSNVAPGLALRSSSVSVAPGETMFADFLGYAFEWNRQPLGGVAHDDVQAVKPFFRLGEQVVQVRQAALVGAHRERLTAGFLDLAHDFPCGGLVPQVAENHRRAVRGEPRDDRAADSPRSAGYQCTFPVQYAHVTILSRLVAIS
jgi:hypothetical protein